MLRPPALHSGDTIALVAPAGPFDAAWFRAGQEALCHLGFELLSRHDIGARQGYLAGSDRRRQQELQEMLERRDVAAVIAARGGYGTLRALPALRLAALRQPKIVIGSSDLTPLLLALWQHKRWVTFYGPMVAPHFGHQASAAWLARLRRRLTTPQAWSGRSLSGTRTLRRGTAEGRLVGGCLSLLTATLGTPYEVETRGALLFFEDVNEAPYRIDRLLTQLLLAGKFRGVRGVAVGTLKGGETVVRERLGGLGIPILWGLPFGHRPRPELVPIGIRARLAGDRLTFLESPLA